jgi:hypothetical protein
MQILIVDDEPDISFLHDARRTFDQLGSEATVSDVVSSGMLVA